MRHPKTRTSGIAFGVTHVRRFLLVGSSFAQPPKTKAVVYDPEGYGFNNDSDDEEMIYEQVE